jgi:hypothetical protein
MGEKSIGLNQGYGKKHTQAESYQDFLQHYPRLSKSKLLKVCGLRWSYGHFSVGCGSQRSGTIDAVALHFAFDCQLKRAGNAKHVLNSSVKILDGNIRLKGIFSCS